MKSYIIYFIIIINLKNSYTILLFSKEVIVLEITTASFSDEWKCIKELQFLFWRKSDFLYNM